MDVGPRPALEIVRDSDDLEALIRWNRPVYVPRRVKEGLQGIEPSETWVVVAYSGSTATDGHAIAIQEVRLDEGQVIVTVIITSPLPGQPASAVMTHPYHVIGISKQDMLVPSQVNWLMVTEDGTVLAETSPDRIPHPRDPVITPHEKQADTIPFQSVACGDLGASLGRDPGLLVARGRDELDEVVGSLNSNALLWRGVWRKLPGNDSANVWMAIVFPGVRVTGGFGIFVQDVRWVEGHVSLTVLLTRPASGRAVSAGHTDPFNLVTISRDDLPVPPGTTWSMVTQDGKLLAETVYPAE